MKSPSGVLLHEGYGQLGGVGLEEAPQGFRQQVVEIVRTSLGNERARLRCQRCRQLCLDSGLLSVRPF